MCARDLMCAQPPEDVPGFKAEPMTQLIKEMLREKLSFRIIEAILDAGEPSCTPSHASCLHASSLPLSEQR